MPANGFSVGRDVSLVIFSSAGIIGTAGLKDFRSQQITAEIKQPLITGVNLYAYLPEGWQGSATFVRMDASLDDFFAQNEAAYYAGQAVPNGQINETITNPDGSISSYTYTGLALKFDSPGEWVGNKEVDQKIAFMASRRIKA